MMPRTNVRRIRATSSLPLLVLTARGDDTDKIIGLELGADDYVQKPYTPSELIAPILAIMHGTRAQPSAEASSPRTVSALSIWSEQRRATLGDQPLALTSSDSICSKCWRRTPARQSARKPCLSAGALQPQYRCAGTGTGI